MSTSTKCRAANPSLCVDPNCPEKRAQRNELEERMQRARANFDFEAYGEAYAELAVLDGRLQQPKVPPLAADENLVSSLIGQALELSRREGKVTRSELVALYKQVPNEVLGETLLGFLKGRKGNNLAIAEAKNPQMYRVLVSNIRQYQPNAVICEQIVDSGDNRARLLLASHLRQDLRAIQGVPWGFVNKLAGDTDPEVREQIAGLPDLYPYGKSSQLTQELRSDPVADVRLALARNPKIGLEDAEVLAQDTNAEVATEAQLSLASLREAAQQQAKIQALATARYEEAYRTRTLPKWEVEEMTDEEYEDYIG